MEKVQIDGSRSIIESIEKTPIGKKSVLRKCSYTMKKTINQAIPFMTWIRYGIIASIQDFKLTKEDFKTSVFQKIR